MNSDLQTGIDPRLDRPIYKQLADIWRAQIAAGLLAPHDPLPAEAQAARQYRIGREAVRQAVAILRGEGLVDTARGIGTRVRPLATRTQLRLAPGEWAITRMPTDLERDKRGIPDGVPIVEIHHEDGTTERHRGDLIEFHPTGVSLHPRRNTRHPARRPR